MLKKTAILAAAMAVIMMFCLSACSVGWRESYEGLLDDIMGKVDVTRELENIDTEEVIREIPSEEALELIQKMWEMAGILVDEKR